MEMRKAYDESQGSNKTIVEYGETRTHQSMKSECDVNRIMDRYQKQGVVTHLNRYQGSYVDLPAGSDYLEAMVAVRNAQEAFESLPSSLRNQFGNNPAAFLDFVQDPENTDRLVKMGLAKAPRPPIDPYPPGQQNGESAEASAESSSAPAEPAEPA